MLHVIKSESILTQPSDLLKKAFDTYYPDISYELYTEPFAEKDKPHWAFDNYRVSGAVSYEVLPLFYTQPGWGAFFESKVGRNRTKCVTYAVDPEFYKSESVKPIYDVGFIGQLYDTLGEREQYLDALRSNFNVFISDTIATRDIGKVYSQCKVIFNHIRYEEVNIRFFEGLALGAQVASHSPALHLLASEGKHFLSFKTIDEAVKRVAFLIEHDDIREKMKRDAREHVLRYHTYRHRAEEMLRFSGLL